MKKILILYGGISKERAISLETGKQVEKELKKKYLTKLCEPKNLLLGIKSFKPDIIFNALHGQFGEDGYIQTILETFKIPYTHSGPVASLLAMNKEASKKFLLKTKYLPQNISLIIFPKKFKLVSLKKTWFSSGN